MVTTLSSHKRAWDARWEEFSDWAEQGKACHDELLSLVDRDTEAFDGPMAAWRLPDGSAEEKAAKEEAVRSLDVLEAMAEKGMESSLSDAGVGALCAQTAVVGAWLNVKVNLPQVTSKASRKEPLERADALRALAESRAPQVLQRVEKTLG